MPTPIINLTPIPSPSRADAPLADDASKSSFTERLDHAVRDGETKTVDRTPPKNAPEEPAADTTSDSHEQQDREQADEIGAVDQPNRDGRSEEAAADQESGSENPKDEIDLSESADIAILAEENSNKAATASPTQPSQTIAEGEQRATDTDKQPQVTIDNSAKGNAIEPDGEPAVNRSPPAASANVGAPKEEANSATIAAELGKEQANAAEDQSLTGDGRAASESSAASAAAEAEAEAEAEARQQNDSEKPGVATTSTDKQPTASALEQRVADASDNPKPTNEPPTSDSRERAAKTLLAEAAPVNQAAVSQEPTTEQQVDAAGDADAAQDSVSAEPREKLAPSASSFQSLLERTTATTAQPAADRAEQASAEPPRVDAGRFVHRVSRAFQVAEQRDGQVQLRLSPPELGAMKIELNVQQGALTAKLETETAAAKNVLLDNLPALRERLAALDIRVDKFDVDVQQQGSENGPDWHAQQDGQNSHRGKTERLPGGREPTTSQDHEATTDSTTKSTHHDGQFSAVA